jgi:hypothetical protein
MYRMHPRLNAIASALNDLKRNRSVLRDLEATETPLKVFRVEEVGGEKKEPQRKEVMKVK